MVGEHKKGSRPTLRRRLGVRMFIVPVIVMSEASARSNGKYSRGIL